ncbi:MAG TPA: ATP-binding protein [Phycisphaerae bacterium]|nr:ATP-binding protein [Phycisphaerae bacterium]HNU44351.1 ATP-binding protein [Phycisphaerae bacterium]
MSFKRFWTAEEVPRWFGLSVVLIYLISLGAVGYLGVHDARLRAAQQYRAQTAYAVELLASRLAAASREASDALAVPGEAEAATGSGDARRTPGITEPGARYQRALREFAAQIGTLELRVLDGRRRVLAATDTLEIGSTLPNEATGPWPPTALQVTETALPGHPESLGLYRIPVVRATRTPAVTTAVKSGGKAEERPAAAPTAPLEAGADAEASGVYLEAIVPLEPTHGLSLADYSGGLALGLVACGALFAVYRALRGQLRGVVRIAGRLQQRSLGIEEDLRALCITDAKDAATRAWNQLVELTASLQTEVERTRANGELSRVLERTAGQGMNEALNALPDGIIYLNNEGAIQYLNTPAGRLLGCDTDKVKGITLVELETAGEPEGGSARAGLLRQRLVAMIRQNLPAEGVADAVNQLLEVSELNSSYRVSIVPLTDARHEGECVVLVRDVSQQLRADRAREEFVAQVTHELRTPLTNIRAYAETLSSGMFDDPKVVTECYNVITKETRRLSRLIEDILSVSQMEVGTIELVEDKVDLKALLTDGVRDVRGLADEKNIDLQLVLPAKLEAVQGDRDKLAVVVNNLLGNALKYTPAGGSVVVGCQLNHNELVLTFKDTGIGIAPADQERVFEKFQRGNDPAVLAEAGTGIGLYTAREIVRRHGGDISLMSKPGEGSTFIVRLPHERSRASSLSSVAGA